MKAEVGVRQEGKRRKTERNKPRGTNRPPSEIPAKQSSTKKNRQGDTHTHRHTENQRI